MSTTYVVNGATAYPFSASTFSTSYMSATTGSFSYYVQACNASGCWPATATITETVVQKPICQAVGPGPSCKVMGKPGIGGTTTNSSPAPAASSAGNNLTDGRVNAGRASTLLASAVPVMSARLPDPALSLVSVPGADDQALASGPSSRRASPSVQSLEIPSALTIASGAPVLAALARERQALSADALVQPTETQMQAIANARPGALATASAGSSGAGCRRLE